MSLVEKCWMITSNVSVIAVLIITGICFGIFVRPYMKKKKEAIAVSTCTDPQKLDLKSNDWRSVFLWLSTATNLRKKLLMPI